MPLIIPMLRARDAAQQVQFNQDAGSSAAWIAASVVGGIILLGAAISFVLVRCSRRRQYRRALQLEPYLTRDEFLRRRKMSAADLLREEEERRKTIIRKSLARRSSDSTGSSRGSAAIDEIERELARIERQESIRLKDDWKRWEARTRRERSMSAGQHPAASAEDGVPILAMPSPAKHRSLGRMSAPNPLVPPPRHPGRPSPAS